RPPRCSASPLCGDPMPNYRYRALTQNGDMVSGSISAASAEEVARRIEYMGLVLIEAIAEEGVPMSRMAAALLSRPRPHDVTIFTRDLALLLRAGARLYDALDLLASDSDVGSLRSTVAQIRTAVASGETFADALSWHRELFPPMYVALVRVGEASGALDHILELLADERTRAEALRRKLLEALQYPAFVLVTACGVLVFFLLFVLPQFSAVLRDFNARTDPVVGAFLDLSDALHAHTIELALSAAIGLIAGWFSLRQPWVRASLVNQFSRLPLVRTVFNFYRSGLFCRNLGILLGSGVTLTATLRILVDIMSSTGSAAAWAAAADRIRHGGKLSEGLAATSVLPP